MSEPKNLGMAAAVAGGYLLGRTRKAQVAITAAAMLAGRGLRPRELVAQGVRKVPGIPDPSAGGGAEGDREAADGGRAVSSLAGRGVVALAEALHQRTAGLTGEPPEHGDGDREPEDSGGDGQDEEPRHQDEEPRHRSSGRPAGKPASRTPRER